MELRQGTDPTEPGSAAGPALVPVTLGGPAAALHRVTALLFPAPRSEPGNVRAIGAWGDRARARMLSTPEPRPRTGPAVPGTPLSLSTRVPSIPSRGAVHPLGVEDTPRRAFPGTAVTVAPPGPAFGPKQSRFPPQALSLGFPMPGAHPTSFPGALQGALWWRGRRPGLVTCGLCSQSLL